MIKDVLSFYSIDYDIIKSYIDIDSNNNAPDSDLSQSASDSKTPTLDIFSIDITLNAKNGDLDPIVGRETEIQRVAQILSRRKKNNPVLIGEPGVGKTAIVEGLALRIVNKTVPRILWGEKVLSLDLAGIIAGTKYRGQFEERIKNLILELESVTGTIIFIDELHTLVGAGATTGSLDVFSGANVVTGATSSATGVPDSTSDSAVTLAGGNTITFTDGYANQELEPDSGEIIYIENRKPISRSSDQTEDIKLIVEF